MVQKIFKGFLITIAAIIALSYTFGYDYLFKSLRETYFRGETGSTINDGAFFKAHTIANGKPIPWEKDSLYNKKPLPKDFVQKLKQSNTASFLVIKNGKLLHEEYWKGYDDKSKTNSFSMAKAVTVMLVAKAIEEKKIKNYDVKFSHFFENYNNIDLGKNLTLKNLAQMEAGLKWKEDFSNPFLPNAKAYYGKSLEKAVLLRGFKNLPGTNFEYQSGATQLLGFALRKSLNQTIAEYASETLWKPLGMENNATWNTDDFGMEKTFCCINSTSRDFAKLGQLLLQDGNYNGRQILQKPLIHAMRQPTKLSRGAYGMGLWINNDAAIKHYYFNGLYGQYIIVIPEKEMVIVRTGMDKSDNLDKKGRPRQVENIINNVVQNFN